jgi:hypothetical protein
LSTNCSHGPQRRSSGADQALCPALDALLKWAALREEMAEGADAASSA